MRGKQARAVRWRRDNEGFTLLEALLAVGLMTLLLAVLSTVTGQWMRGWKAGLDNTQSADLLALGLDRIVADIGAAEFISPGQGDARPLFQGTDSSVTFVRSAIGPNAKAGLEVVRLAEIDDARGRIVVRTRAEFTPSVTAGAIELQGPTAYGGKHGLTRRNCRKPSEFQSGMRKAKRYFQLPRPRSSILTRLPNAPPVRHKLAEDHRGAALLLAPTEGRLQAKVPERGAAALPGLNHPVADSQLVRTRSDLASK